MFTPINIVMKCTLAHRACSVRPENSGNQCENPPKIANTAPIDST